MKKDPPELRPIGARALKSAIDTLRPHLQGARVLDLFAGQGRFGIEALNEGAESVTFVENHPGSVATLKVKVSSHGDKASVRRQEVMAYLGMSRDLFDLAFADPPFPLWNEAFFCSLFSAVATHLVPDSIFLVKYPARMIPCVPVIGFREWKTTPFGESKLLYYRYEKDKASQKG